MPLPPHAEATIASITVVKSEANQGPVGVAGMTCPSKRFRLDYLNPEAVGEFAVQHVMGLGAVLFVLWLMLSGHYEPLFFAFGLISIALCVWIARRMDVADGEGVPIRLGLRTPLYWPWLFWQIAKSNVDVARRILDPRLPISPTTLRIATGQRTALGRVVFANSLTLTPGTVSMSIDDDTILVHALTEENARALEGGEMRRRVAAFEGDAE